MKRKTKSDICMEAIAKYDAYVRHATSKGITVTPYKEWLEDQTVANYISEGLGE